ncbi:hypothetical protein JCM6882_006572 [Rhodosporidiobolus microsporus]
MDGFAGAGVLASASLKGVTQNGELSKPMGRDQSVYAGELEGARLALEAARPFVVTHQAPALTLCIDNQALLKAPVDPRASPGQQHRLDLRSLLHRYNRESESTRLTLLWSPGHVSLAGNERADELAKEASEEGRRRSDEARAREEQRVVHRHGWMGRVYRPGMSMLSKATSVWSEFVGEEGGSMTEAVEAERRRVAAAEEDGWGVQAQHRPPLPHPP